MKHIIYSIGELSVPGGIGRIISLKANWFVKHGYKVTILTTEGSSVESFYKLLPEIEIVPLNINYLTVYDNKRNLSGLFKSMLDRLNKTRKHKLELKKYLMSHHCDVFFTTGNIPFVTKFKDGSKKIYEVHFSSEAQRQFIHSANFFLRAIYRVYNVFQQKQVEKYDKFVVLTQRDYELRNKPKNGCIIPNFITSERREEYPDYDNQKVISVGRLDYVKGFDLLIEAWKDVYAKHPNWRLDIYGHSYNRKQYYQSLIINANLQNIITIHDAVQNIEDKYMESSFYVMASRYEGFPLVLPEAMSCGLPCICYDINCGPSDIIKNGEDGIILKSVGNIKDLSEAICFMIENPSERKKMGIRAKKNIQRFRIDSVMQNWLKLIEN